MYILSWSCHFCCLKLHLDVTGPYALVEPDTCARLFNASQSDQTCARFRLPPIAGKDESHQMEAQGVYCNPPFFPSRHMARVSIACNRPSFHFKNTAIMINCNGWIVWHLDGNRHVHQIDSMPTAILPSFHPSIHPSIDPTLDPYITIATNVHDPPIPWIWQKTVIWHIHYSWRWTFFAWYHNFMRRSSWNEMMETY